MRSDRSPGLLRTHATFRYVWTASTVSLVGDRFTILAVPTLALFELNGTPGQVAMLFVAQSLPGALLALPAAAHLVGRSERATMMACDLLRGSLLVTVVILALTGRLALWHLFAVVTVVAVATTVFNIAAQALVPKVVDPADYVAANSRFAQAGSGAGVIGPIIAGTLIGAVGPVYAVLTDAVSFLLSWALLTRIPGGRPPPADVGAESAGSRVWARLRDGCRFIGTHRDLRFLAAAYALFNLGGAMIGSLWYPYLLDGLGLSPGLTGTLMTIGGASAFGTALMARRVIERWSARAILPASLGIGVAALWLIPLAARGPAVPLLLSYLLVFSSAAVLFGVVAATARQSMTPQDQQGRVYAVFYTLSLLSLPAGGALATSVAAAASVVTAIAVGAALAGSSLVTIRALAGIGREEPGAP
jgi:hypothetical protein